MSLALAISKLTAPFRHKVILSQSSSSRLLHTCGLSHEAVAQDRRARLSRVFIPTGGIAADAQEDSHAKLLRAGFLRQAHPGVFHLLPLGRRVLNKLESLVDKHMYGIGASKMELSSLSSEELWSKSGRLQTGGTELFRLQDRKGSPYLLSPTHEEEITSLASDTVKSYKDLPLLLYQITRKYRDELRPRHGLLRSREFVMKDLYTFDVTESQALQTYSMVRKAYVRLFKELKLPFMVAEADSGNIGGNLSHEFHFPTSKGEDVVISCSACDYVANEELAESPQKLPSASEISQARKGSLNDDLAVWRGVTKDRSILVNVWYMKTHGSALPASQPNSVRGINMHAIKRVFPGIDTSLEDSTPFWRSGHPDDLAQPQPIKVVNLVDSSVPEDLTQILQKEKSCIHLLPENSSLHYDIPHEFIIHAPSTGATLNLLRIKDGDVCPRCSEGRLRVDRAIELGHTFHLGSRYSTPLNALVSTPKDSAVKGTDANQLERYPDDIDRRVPFQMGCHGIGVTRVIGAVADTLADEKGLNWPRVMAPFEVVVMSTVGLEDAAVGVYDSLLIGQARYEKRDDDSLDAILDDRALSFAWKMRDADLIGYPVIVIVGRNWNRDKQCEVQCRRLGIKQDVNLTDLPTFVRSVLQQL